MNNYTLYCSKEQTMKALTLGAPIMIATEFYDLLNREYFVDQEKEHCVVIPTAEQMIGWLEEQEILIDVTLKTGIVYIYDRANKVFVKTMDISSIREGTLKGIDAALEYLNNNRKQQ